MSELILFIALYYHTPNFAGNGIHLHRMSKLTREDGKFRQTHRHKKKYVSPLRLGVFARYIPLHSFSHTVNQNTGGKSWL